MNTKVKEHIKVKKAKKKFKKQLKKNTAPCVSKRQAYPCDMSKAAWEKLK